MMKKRHDFLGNPWISFCGLPMTMREREEREPLNFDHVKRHLAQPGFLLEKYAEQLDVWPEKLGDFSG